MYNPSIALYRRILKSLRSKFVGDRKSYVEFRNSFKQDILRNKLKSDPFEISQLIFDFDVTREWILTEVTRADLQKDGKYKLRINKEQLQSIQVKPVRHPEYFEFNLPSNLIQK
jgi:hypothetical protein